MSFFQLFIGLLLILSWAGRPILYKPVAKYFPPSMSPAFTSTWLMIALIITFPFLGYLILDNYKQTLLSPFILFSIYKGASLFYLIKYQQIVNKESTSSSVFLSFIALAIGCLANNLLFHEGLPFIKIYSIAGLGLLGLLFFVKGDAGRLSKKARLAFIITTLIMASYTISDYLAISEIGWYPHLLISSVVMFIVSLLNKISKQDFKNIFTNKGIVGAGIFYAVTEFLVIYVSINILPVSIVAVFLRLSVPVVMVYSAIRYKEQNLIKQLYFAVAAILLVLPIILIKG